MNLHRLLLRLALGRRLPTAGGEVRTAGLTAPVTVRRDKWGIPHVEAQADADAWFGLGFCHGQDRAFQLETLLRVARGTLAELVGPEGLALDRLSRRIGFRRAAEKQFAAQHDDVKAILAAYTAGVTAGLTGRPHELAILNADPTPWAAADVLAFFSLQSFLLPSNWDVELARLRILLADGPAALRALDPAYPDWHPVTAPDGGVEPRRSLAVLDRLGEDIAALQRFLPTGGGSNNWAVAGSRTLSGKPLLANDPHLAPTVPPLWYLAHVRTPDWELAGATMVGAPAFPVGHNGFACWGMTAGLTDTTDLFVETLGPDGTTVREADGSFAPCEVVREVIRVRGRPDVTEDVLVTPRGPVLSAAEDVPLAISLRAVWLGAHPVRGLLDAARARDFETFRQAFAHWPALPQNVAYADASGTVGWQLIGQLPIRKGGHGLLPRPADDPGAGWDGLLPFDRMPHLVSPAEGFVATANNKPADDPALGFDYCDGYRAIVIREELAKHPVGWTAIDCQKLQLNQRSKPWEELRPVVLELTPDGPDARQGLDLLRRWDGRVAADSAGAAVFELFLAELCVRVAKAKAPKSFAAVLGGTGIGPLSHNLFGDRRVGHLVRLLRDQPSGWFPRPWADELLDALGSVVRRLRSGYGPGPAWWQWGDVRPLAITHVVFGDHRLLGPAFNLPRVAYGGDMNTVCQAAWRPLAPTAPAHMVANLRAVFDTADWANSRFALAGGQSGNPLSPHYDDLFDLWRRGEGVPIPTAPAEVLRQTAETLRLVPG